MNMNIIDIGIIIYIIIIIISILIKKNNKKESFKEKKRINIYYAIKRVIYYIILKKTKRVLDKLNINFFLSSGTCLGYFREGKFIDHDYDIDIGIFKDDFTPKIILEMKKEKLHLYRILGNVKNGLELSFKMLGTPLGRRAKIDIFLHYLEKEKNSDEKYISWYSYKIPDYKKKIKYRVSAFKLIKVIFMGIEVFVPYPTKKYIEEHYGLDWMIPKKPFTEYNYYKSPKSIVYIK